MRPFGGDPFAAAGVATTGTFAGLQAAGCRRPPLLQPPSYRPTTAIGVGGCRLRFSRRRLPSNCLRSSTWQGAGGGGQTNRITQVFQLGSPFGHIHIYIYTYICICIYVYVCVYQNLDLARAPSRIQDGSSRVGHVALRGCDGHNGKEKCLLVACLLVS